MKTIFITIPWFYPAYKAGGPIQSVANMVDMLRQDQHENDFQFKIFTSNKDLDGTILTVEVDQWVDYTDNTKVWYVAKNNLLTVLEKQIKKEQPNCLFIIGIYSWHFNFKPLFFCKGVKKIISVRGMLHSGALSQKSFKKNIFLKAWKLLGLHKKTIFHATDREEKKHIQKVFGGKAKVMVAGNFPRVLEQQKLISKIPGELKMVSIGLISPMKNILLVLEALESRVKIPSARRRVESKVQPQDAMPKPESSFPDEATTELGIVNRESLIGVTGFVNGLQDPLVGINENIENLLSSPNNFEYNIYGPVKDEEYWHKCLLLIKKIPSTVRVNYHGDIPPANIEEALRKNHVFIMPSKSENFGHAIYEALSAGRPVITSNNTPWMNLLSSKAGINVSLDDDVELQKAIEKFAEMSEEEIRIWSFGARAYAMSALDVEKTKTQYNDMFD